MRQHYCDTRIKIYYIINIIYILYIIYIYTYSIKYSNYQRKKKARGRGANNRKDKNHNKIT